MTILRAGLIGAGIGQSRLSAALKLMCHAHGMDLDFTPIDTASKTDFDFDRTVDDLRAQGWHGVTVTHPHKVQARAYAGPAMGPEFRHLSAANTLTFRPELAGHNTDFTGFLGAWKSVMGNQTPGRVAMAGAGGVARAIAPALLELGASEISIWDPTPGLADALAVEVGDRATAIPMSGSTATIPRANGLVNATPLGMTGHPGSAFSPDLIGEQSWAFDAVYTPTDTEFLMIAHNRRVKTLTGFDLFRFMAIRSFTAYTGIAPDPATVLPKLDALRPREVA